MGKRRAWGCIIDANGRKHSVLSVPGEVFGHDVLKCLTCGAVCANSAKLDDAARRKWFEGHLDRREKKHD